MLYTIFFYRKKIDQTKNAREEERNQIHSTLQEKVNRKKKWNLGEERVYQLTDTGISSMYCRVRKEKLNNSQSHFTRSAVPDV